EALLRSWSHGVDRQIQESAAGRNVTEWCKKEACWTGLRNLDLAVSNPLPPEWGSASVASGGAGPELAAPDAHAAAACMR
ncbi:AIPR protein, partial [Escherichia coli]